MGLGVFGQDHDRLWRWIGSFYYYLQDWWTLKFDQRPFSRFLFTFLILCVEHFLRSLRWCFLVIRRIGLDLGNCSFSFLSFSCFHSLDQVEQVWLVSTSLNAGRL